VLKLNAVVSASVVAGSICLFGSPVKAAVIINAVESNGNVLFNYNGTIDTTGLTIEQVAQMILKQISEAK
jgi:protein involved in polysaccharide export with SLBB domain